MLEKSKTYIPTREQLIKDIKNLEFRSINKMNGKVKSQMVSKSFGFIYGEDGKEYFFHITGVIGNFSDYLPGKNVTFEPEDSPKGKRAERVELV